MMINQNIKNLLLEIENEKELNSSLWYKYVNDEVFLNEFFALIKAKGSKINVPFNTRLNDSNINSKYLIPVICALPLEIKSHPKWLREIINTGYFEGPSKIDKDLLKFYVENNAENELMFMAENLKKCRDELLSTEGLELRRCNKHLKQVFHKMLLQNYLSFPRALTENEWVKDNVYVLGELIKNSDFSDKLEHRFPLDVFIFLKETQSRFYNHNAIPFLPKSMADVENQEKFGDCVMQSNISNKVRCLNMSFDSWEYSSWNKDNEKVKMLIQEHSDNYYLLSAAKQKEKEILLFMASHEKNKIKINQDFLKNISFEIAEDTDFMFELLFTVAENSDDLSKVKQETSKKFQSIKNNINQKKPLANALRINSTTAKPSMVSLMEIYNDKMKNIFCSNYGYVFTRNPVLKEMFIKCGFKDKNSWGEVLTSNPNIYKDVAVLIEEMKMKQLKEEKQIVFNKKVKKF